MAITRLAPILGIGASYVQEGYATIAYNSVMQAILALVTNDSGTAATAATNLGFSVPVGSLPNLDINAFGGSAALETYQSPAGNYWVTNAIGTGPRLTTALAAIAGYSPKPFATIYDHTQQDAILVPNEAASFNVKSAVSYLLAQVRSAISAGSPTAQPIFVEMLGPRYASTEFGEYWVRDRLIEIVLADAKIFFGAETYALQLDQTIHPNTPGYRQLGAHTGRKVAAYMLDKTSELRGPSIASAVKNGSGVLVSFTVPAGKTLVQPANPDFFGVFDGDEVRIPPTSYGWAAGQLQIYLPASPVPVKFRYPARSSRTLDINNIVRLTDPASPLYVGEPGLVLESIKTITL